MTSSIVVSIFMLLVVYQLKHFVADFPLQREFMLGKFKDGYDWILPLLAHVAVHGAFTLLIVVGFLWSQYRPLDYGGLIWRLPLIDMSVHFTMDRIKAWSKLLGRYKPLDAMSYHQARLDLSDYKPVEMKWWHARKKLNDNRMFWHSIGIDQMVHHLTHYFIIYKLISVLM